MKIVRKGETRAGLGETFTGEVWQQRILASQREGGMGLTVVRFENGARTHWHMHPGEQILFVLEGEGRVGTESEETTISPGDVVYAAPGEKHWHGAARGKSMTHISITNVGPPEWYDAPADE
jgi:quercetin dioxygenase-like cupin family protein